MRRVGVVVEDVHDDPVTAVDRHFEAVRAARARDRLPRDDEHVRLNDEDDDDDDDKKKKNMSKNNDKEDGGGEGRRRRE